MTPKECADTIRNLMKGGKEPSKIIEENPELAPGLDLVIKERPPRGTGTIATPPKFVRDGLNKY